MSIRLVDHLNIVTEKLAETRDFYVKVLKLEVGWRPGFASEGYWLYAGERAVVHIQQAVHPVGPTEACALNHAAFIVDDFDGLVASLKAHGVAYDETCVPGSSVRQAFFLDPNGVRLELSDDPGLLRTAAQAAASA
jgi:catechol 2,3-dioxygenase-like lactoylglutathione lyase family enzyme